jgi:hypothetical protein
MNLLKTIIERLNQRVEVANIFDQIYPLCELNANGNEKAWVHYIGNGQAEVVTNFDAKQGTLFWAKRGKVSVTKTESLKVSGCKSLYLTTFPLTAYAVVRKSHLPCDSEDSQDWIASRIYRLISGTDPDFKVGIGVIQYEVIPNGYVNEIKSLTANYEWACVAVDVDVSVVSSSEDGCYDVCSTGDIPLPDFEPCTPCLTEVAVDGVTITGNGTTADPLVAIGGGGGGGIITAIAFSTDHLASTGNQYVVGNVVWYNGNIYRCIANNDSLLPTNTTYWVNLGVGFQTIERPIDWNATSGNNQILNKPTIPILPSTIVEDVTATLPLSSTGGTTPDISITQADSTTDGYLSQTDWNTFDGKFNVPTGTITDYLDGLGTPTPFPTIPTGSVTSVDLTMPSAFSVTGNPITTSGTLAVSANGLSTQYIRGDGQLANFPTTSGGGSSVSYYLNGSVNQGTFAGSAYEQMSKTPVFGGGTTFTRTNAQGNGLIAQFITDANDPSVLSIPAGNWNLELFFRATSSGGSPSYYVELYKYDGATFTLIASDSATPEGITNGTTLDAYFTALAVPATTLAVTDRLALRVFVNTSGRTIELHTENGHLCQVITTFSTGLNSLNGLTAQVQNFAVGTSGTDFGISSASATHTFNLPTASATNRGALSTTDWTTFNGKVATTRSIGTTAPLTGGGDLSADRTIAIAKATALVDGYLAATDFTTFAAKQDALTLTTTGTSGAATLTGATLNIPIYAAPVIYKSAADSASFLSTTNTVVYTQLVDANTFAAGDIIRLTYRAKKTGTVGAASLRIYVNATANLSGTPLLVGTLASGQTGSRFNQMQRHLVVKSSTNNTETAITTATLATDVINTGDFATISVNWTNALYFVFALQNTSALDTNLGSMYLIEKL